MSSRPSGKTLTVTAELPLVPVPAKANPLVPKVVSSVPFAEYLEMRVRGLAMAPNAPTTMIFPSVETFIP